MKNLARFHNFSKSYTFASRGEATFMNVMVPELRMTDTICGEKNEYLEEGVI